MQLKTPQRREFIEQILDIGVFSLMNDLLKVRQSGVKTRLDQISRDTLSLKEQTGLVRGFITKLEDEAKKASQDIQEQIDQGNDSIAGLMSQMAALTSIELALTDTITDADAITKGIKSKLDFQRQGLQKIREAEQVIAFYVGHDTCSTCSQEIGEAHRNAIVSKNQSIIDRVLVVLVELDTDLVAKRSRQKEIDGVLKKIQKVNAEVQEATGSVRVARRYVGKLNEDLKKQPGNVQEQYDRLAALNAKHVELEIEREETLELKRCHEVASVLLKDGGIKSAIIKQYLPMINRLVNKYLAELDFFLSFTLDEGFSETFKSRNRDAMSYFSFSEGEKLRIDLALLFTWREVARMKNSCATNLLILDEVIDSSLDNNGTDFFIRMLHDLGGASNVFVISHKSDAALDKFEDVIRFHKHGNFSRRDDVEVIPSVAT
jgi:DNA repair exonuclease SbcCD ATPase subunit